MARFYGKVGFSIPYESETEPGVYKDHIEERSYFGSLIQHTRRWANGEGVNDDLALENKISILADDYSYAHCSAIKYVFWMNQYWKVNSIKVESPRIILSLGGVWNGEKS